MPIIKKTLFAENLERYKVLVEDTDPFSKYFKITELKDTFTGGKNAFLIQGSTDLVSDTLVKLEIKDAQGNVIYHEPGMGVPEYYEGTSKVISVYIYPDTAYGPCTITILGELSQYDNNGLITPIPLEWEGKYNVKWQKQINVNPALPNTTKIRFYNRPSIDITEIIQPLYNRTSVTKTATLGTISGVSVIPDVNTNYRTYNGNTRYQLNLVGGYFSSSMVGETITVNGLPQSYTTTIASVINQSSALATIPYYETSSNTTTSSVNDQIIKNFSNKNYSVSYTDSVSYSGSFLSSSYAQIVLTDLETFTGDANRIKIYAKSLNQNAGFKLLQDFTLESTELLLTSSFNGDINVGKGVFRAQSVIDQFWTSSLLNSIYPLTASFDNATLASSVKLIVTSSKNTTDLPLNKFTTKDSISFLKNTEYTLEYTPLLSSSLYTNNKIEIYGSGSAFIDSNSNKLGKLIDTINADGLFQRFDLQQVNFKPDQDGDGKILFVPYQGQWQLSDISLRASQETFFSPNQIVVNVNVPTVIPNETFDFKFEFYDINNNLVYPLTVEKNYTFTGGNDTIVGTITIIDNNITAVSQSISGTMTVYSSSASSSVGTLSGSVSGSITNLSSSVSGTIATLSSSVSASNVYILSSSLSKTQQLADGQFSGSFIGDTVVYSPTIGGQQGYISQLFKVGTAPSIYLDARQTPRKIFIGGAIPTGQTEYSGAFNNSNTNVYMDSGGKFSLGNKLSWDGNTLSTSGTIVANAGSIGGVNIASNKIYVGTGTYAASNTGFYLDDGGQFSLKDKLTWNGTTLTVTGNINISGGDAATKISDAALSGSNAQTTANSAASAASSAQSTANTAIDRIFTDSAGKITKVAAPSGKGLFLDSTHLGFYNTTDYPSSPWRTYMNSNGDFYLTGGGSNGLTWNAAASTLSIDGNITARNGTFYGDITSTANITGGTITGGTISGGTITGATGTFTGTITATGGSIGNWSVTGGNLQTSNGRMVLDASAPAITLKDASLNTKTTIRTGPLSYISSAYTTVGGWSITSPSVNGQGWPATYNKVYIDSPYSLGTLAVGTWNANYSVNYISSPGNVVQVDAYTQGWASYTIGIDIVNSAGTVLNTFTVGTATVSNSTYNSSAVYNTLGAQTAYLTLTINSSQEYFARPFYTTYVGTQAGTGYARVLGGKVASTPPLSFTKVSSFAELTDEGMQIVSSTSRYITMKTGGAYDLDAKGTWYHDAGDVQFVNSTGQLYARASLVTTAAGNYSDIRLKEDISDYNFGLEHIKQFNPKWFRFIKRYNDKFLSGLIAQDVESISADYINEDAEGMKELNYPAVYMTMVNAIKELSNKIDELEAKISGSI